jgi:hypothetical protein
MANSFVRYTGNGSTTAYSIPFSYRSTADLAITLAGVASTAFTLNAAGTTLTFNTAPANAVAIEIRRRTSQGTKLVDYASGSVLTENDLDTDSDQAFFMGQEAIDDANDVIKVSNTDFQWDAQNKRLTNVADPTAAQHAATKNYLENTWLSASDKTTLNNVNSNISAINTVNSNMSAITTTNSNATNINTVATNIASVNTVATDITKVIAVANDLAEAVSEVETVADDLNETTSEIDTVATNIANVNTVGTGIANVNTVAGISANVTTVAGIHANVTSVAGISSAVSAVNSNATNINAVNSNSSNINTVAGLSSAISTVNSNSSNINTVAGNNTNINTVAGANSNITAVAGGITNINTVATNLAAVNNFADVYRISSSAPTSSLTLGDLYFDTSANELKVYKSSGWAAAGSTVNGTSNRFEYTATANQTTFTGSDSNSKTLAYDAGFIDVYLNGVKLANADFTATSGTSVVLGTGASANDILMIVAYGTFQLANISINDLTNTPASIGTAGQALVVNSAGNALEYANASSAEVYGFNKYYNPSTLVKTVTVSSVGGSNKYFIDGVQQDTLDLYEGNTYVFNYPSAHPFKFSTTSNGTHASGSEYTTGVTHNSSTQVTIVVASGAPTLYYYCSSHSAMGGTANTPTPANNAVQYITTNQGQDNITESQYANFDDVLFSASGFVFSINSNGNLISTI